VSKKVVLVITDGIGHSTKSRYNAFANAKKPTYDSLFENVPYSLIETHGLSVGLPKGQMGNSEVGHMSIGSGRVLYQDLVRISLALEDGSLEANEEFKKLLASSKTLHLVGLVSDGGVHSHIDHLNGVARLASRAGLKVWIHAITDGRDVSPTSAKIYLDQIYTDENVRIATVAGRFYTMDRDNRWDRVKLGYDAIVEASPKTTLDPLSYIDASYAKDELDEFVLPTAFGGYNGVSDGDALLMFNFRSDRVREITSALGSDEFGGFERAKRDLYIATMSEYDSSFNFSVLFKKEIPQNTLAEVVSNAKLRQLHTAETEKYAHVTFFLNGGIEEPFVGESRVLIPSPKVKTYDLQPQMSAPQVGDAVLAGMREGYDLVVVNFANGDMVGHTGDYEAAMMAVEAVDHELGRIVDLAKREGYAVLITSDHGNCEEMRADNGSVLTNHTVGEVYCFVIADGVRSVESGALCNIAPTVLKLMGLEIPQEMQKPLI